MAHTLRENVEILVHTSAPSRGQDDTRYRAFARAYLNFESATSLQLQDDPQEDTGNGAEREGLIEGAQHLTQEYDENASYCLPTQEPETNPGAYREIPQEELSDLMFSPQLSFRSVLDNRNSPMFRTRSRTLMSLQVQSGSETPEQSHLELGTSSGDKTPWRDQFMDSLPASKRESSVIEDSMLENDRILAQFSSPRRISELHQQQEESTQDSADANEISQYTDESSLNLEVPLAIPITSSQNGNAHPDFDAAISLPPRPLQTISPPYRRPKAGYQHVNALPIATSDEDDLDVINSDRFNNTQASGQAANTSSRRASQATEMEEAAEFTHEEVNPTGFSKKGSTSNAREIPEPSSSLPQHVHGKRQRLDFPSSLDKSPKRLKLVISDTTAETSSASLPAPQRPPTSTALEAPKASGVPSSVPSSSVPPMSSLPSAASLATCTIPSFTPPTSVGDFKETDILTPSLKKIKANRGNFNGLQKKHFNPTFQTRPCRPLERGYWLIHAEDLGDLLKKRLWSYLLRVIPKGDLGWGISAERTNDWNTVRVYCWGGVVKEIYLMLFCASENKLKYGDACWKDADGEIVILMPKEIKISSSSSEN
ncbi:uncharacterized protein Bfra_012057 [Botrytis fragariae]|uniref:Uncharacterized protein n=1 Tax=Botrytis fragariae TaxID=1964551 RepID=A0A8H6EE18_9HELO|nr:uncharacterized protein Bfra_012057 [Botrytis fragariae]KAF5868726.1 hypothetical protein Bfra_012057 [Botrytis fragariae]